MYKICIHIHAVLQLYLYQDAINVYVLYVTRFFDFHWPITLILVWIFQIFWSAITFWVIWSTYLSKFALVGCFINFQKLKNRVALSNRVRCVWTFMRKVKNFGWKVFDVKITVFHFISIRFCIFCLLIYYIFII
jgi:hypothetical protein